MVLQILVRYFSLQPIIRMSSSQEFSAHRTIATFSNGWFQDEIKDDYNNAIESLNTLQSNAATIKESLASGKLGQNVKFKNTITYLKRSGLSQNDLDKLSVIHVSGTKGKGTTCAITETILRSYGVQTGFFSSPHLISVTERIRINGVPIDEKRFTKYFWKVWKRLQIQKTHNTDMPAYFNFLTILCFHIFLEEKVEAVILEVGIGGEYDCTNIIRNTKTVGITSLGLEHTNILGTTLEEIAWQKAGIIKQKCNVFTSVSQDACLDIIEKRAKQKNASLIKVKNFNVKDWNVEEIVRINCPLAIHLACDWLKHNRIGKLSEIRSNVFDEVLEEIMPIAEQILKNFTFPGRCQFLKIKNLNMYLDGAHTVESVSLSSSWFSKSTKNSTNQQVLVFNLTGDREALKLLKIIEENCNISLIYFTPNTPFFQQDSNVNNLTLFSENEKLQRVKDIFENCRTRIESDSMIFATILESLNHISQSSYKNEVDVFVTGSVHLIGATLIALEQFSKIKN